MKQRIIRLLPPAALLTAACLLAACTDDNTGRVGGDGETLIELTLQLPATTGGAATRAITGEPFEENNIADAQVLAFIEKGTDWVYDYTATVKKIEDTQGGRSNRDMTITATVRELSVKQRFAVFANSAVEVAAINYIIPGKTIEEVERKIVSKTGSGEWPARINKTGTFTPFPMYAYTDAETIASGINTIGTYPMIRMVARIDVALHDTIPLTNFKLINACLFNYKTEGYVSYRESGFDGSKATAPAVPSDGDHSGDPVKQPTVTYDINDAGKIESAIYTFEAEAITSESDMTKKTALVIGGYYNSSTTLSYYRIDLKDYNLGSGNISDGILRNHLYKVVVQSVTGVGYTTPESAYMGDARLTAMVRPWDLAKQGVIGDGKYYLDVEMDTEGMFRRWVNGSTLTTVKAETDYDIDYQGFSPGIYVDTLKVVYEPAVTSGNEWLIFTFTQNSDGSLTREFTVEIDRKKVPRNSYNPIAKVPVTAGNMTKIVYIEYMNECYPESHNGWAGSNIYWDGTKLTFDDVGVTTHEQYQGLYFQWGGLHGISPKDAWSGSTMIYTPEGTSKTASSMWLSLSWDTSPWMPRVSNGTIPNYPPTGLGKTIRDRAYLHELSAANGDPDGTGDICKHLTEQGWAPAGKWRMPTSNEFEAESNYSAWVSGTNDLVEPDGTAALLAGISRIDGTSKVFFPASGVRFGSNEPDHVNDRGYYWSASPSSSKEGLCFYFNNSQVTPPCSSFRLNGFTVRCVKE